MEITQQNDGNADSCRSNILLVKDWDTEATHLKLK